MKEDQIDRKTLEISQEGDEVYTDLVELADQLPDNSPRFLLLSYPLTLVRISPCKRLSGGVLKLIEGTKRLLVASRCRTS